MSLVRRAFGLLLLAAAVALADEPTIEWFEITGPATVDELDTATYHVVAHYSDGTSVNVDELVYGWNDQVTGPWDDPAVGVWTPDIVDEDTLTWILVTYNPPGGSQPQPIMRQVTIVDAVVYHAFDDEARTTVDTPIDLSVAANDVISVGYAAAVTGTTEPAHGTVVNLGGAVLRYTPAAGYEGPDSFDYTLGGTSTATVSLYVGHAVDYELATGWSAVAHVLADAGTGSAASLAAQLPGVTALYWWDAGAQAWIGYTVGVDPDVALPAGTACMATGATGANARFIGVWPAALSYELTTGHNLITLPVEQADVTTAAALLAAIPDCLGVWRWRTAEQRWSGWLRGFGGDDFALSPGAVVLVTVDGAGGTWPQ